jgi:glycosyltransferase involved in cell wall biosynthesis
MKVVLLHDWLTGFRGGERVLEAFCELFPEAPIYTLIHKKGSTSPIIESKEIITSFLNDIPGIHENYRKFLPLMPLAAEKIKIHHEADIILSSSHCVIKGVKKPQGSKHICYIHSPMRYIYDQFDNYFAHTSLITRTAAHMVRPYLTLWDRDSNNNVDQFLANSSFVADRINLFYNREAHIVNPFVDLKDFVSFQRNPPEKENFFVMVSAFAPNKRIDLAIQAFNQLGTNYKLKIIGSGSKEEALKLKKMAGPNIDFLGNLSREEIVQAFFRARAFIFPGIEDFGITPLESLAAGTPVIALKKAGVLDTLTEKTAHFFHEQTDSSLKEAILEFEGRTFQKEDLYKRAQEFSKEIFSKKILHSISLSQSLKF